MQNEFKLRHEAQILFSTPADKTLSLKIMQNYAFGYSA